MVGAKATNALSYFFNVSSVRDGKEAIATFQKGKNTFFDVREWKNKEHPHGTKIDFMPDPEIFKEGITLDYNDLKKQLQELAYLSPGLLFHFQYKNKEAEDITSNRGILDYIDDLRGASFTNVSLEVGEYFDFNYKDMCLTISKNNYRNVCKLAESVELWNDKEETYIGTLDFDDLEKIVLGYDE